MDIRPDQLKPSGKDTTTTHHELALDHEVVANALEKAEPEPDGDGQASQEALAPTELVSEEALDTEELDISTVGSEPATAPAPGALTALGEALDAAGFRWELTDTDPLSSKAGLLFDLPAGRSTRPVVVDAMDARRILNDDISQWRSLERYDGIWNGHCGIIEVALRPDQVPTSFLLRRIVKAVGRLDAEVEKDRLAAEVADEESGITIRIGEASDFAAVLLTGRRPFRSRPPLTLRISPVSADTTDDADLLIERVTDSVALDLSMSIGVTIFPQRLENRATLRRGAKKRAGRFTFPKSRYPHAPATLYQAGRNHRTSPLIRYWCFYQVLEYFFPTHSQAAAMTQLARHLRSPAFDPHSDEDVLKAVHLATSAGRGHDSEEDQLHTTLRAIVTPHEMVEFLDETGLNDQVSDRRSELSGKTVNTKSNDDLLLQLARRIYDIRCRIVHSKSGRAAGEGAGLLPGTHHDDLVRHELILLEFLAQQALITAADRVSLPRL